MVNELNKTNFLEEFSRLPLPLQEVLSSSFLGQTVSDALNLAQANKEKYHDLMEATSEVLMLHISPEQFEQLLISQYGFNHQSAQIINKIINDKIFSPLKSLLKKEKISNIEPNSSESLSPVPQKIQQISTLPKKIQFPDFSKVLAPKSKIAEKPITASEYILPESKKPKQTTIPEVKITSELPKTTTLPSNEPLKEKEIETKKTETPPIPEIKIPEPVDIKIEKPLQQNIEAPPLTIPEVSADKKEKIKETLLKVMTSRKTETPKIVEEMAKVEKAPIKKTQQTEIKKEKSTVQLSEVSQVVTGKNNKFTPQERKITSSSSKASVLDVKIKEFEEKKEELPKTTEPIAYQKHLQEEEKPFGET